MPGLWEKIKGLHGSEFVAREQKLAEVLGEEVDVVGLKHAVEAPRPIEIPLEAEAERPEDAADTESDEGQGSSNT